MIGVGPSVRGPIVVNPFKGKSLTEAPSMATKKKAKKKKH
jgi:hypothetical protein